jgi:hypothetical protein
MMTHYNRIDLGPAWVEIQNYILGKIVPNEPVDLVSKIFGINDTEFMLTMYRLLNAPLAKCGFVNRIPKGAILFGNGPGQSAGIHIDGYSLERKNASNFALNIPILNCEQGYMNWYNGEYELVENKTKEGLKLLKIKWKEEPKVIERALINEPTIVQVNVPHNVENLSDQQRLMLSIRFVPDLAVLDQ